MEKWADVVYGWPLTVNHSNRVVLATSNSRLFHKKIMKMVTVFSFSINIYLGNQ